MVHPFSPTILGQKRYGVVLMMMWGNDAVTHDVHSYNFSTVNIKQAVQYDIHPVDKA